MRQRTSGCPSQVCGKWDRGQQRHGKRHSNLRPWPPAPRTHRGLFCIFGSAMIDDSLRTRYANSWTPLSTVSCGTLNIRTSADPPPAFGASDKQRSIWRLGEGGRNTQHTSSETHAIVDVARNSSNTLVIKVLHNQEKRLPRPVVEHTSFEHTCRRLPCIVSSRYDSEKRHIDLP